MSKQYRDAVSREDFKKERRSQNRKAGEVFGADTFPDGAPIMDPDEDNIYSYNTSAFGAGSGKDTERLSKIDIKNLKNQGYSKEDIVAYADNIGETGVITDGGAAQRLLDRYRKSLSKNKPVEPIEDEVDPIEDVVQPVDPITPIDPIDDRDDPPFTDIPSIIGGPGVDVGDYIPSPGTNINQGNSLLQSIIQDNDIASAVYGDGNVTTINQDNTASNYGGNQYNFARIPGYYS